MKLHHLLLQVSVLLIFSCSHKPSQQKLDKETYNLYLESGSKIAGQAQSTLLSQVSKAMKKGGSLYAVEYCNLKVSDLTDSLNNECNCIISRVSAKNRNPRNALETEIEKQLWEYFLTINNMQMIHDTIVEVGQKAIYYKPILTGMPTCLQCHGPVEEIEVATYKKIHELYPNDKAVGYGLNELRGLWKIEFNN